MLKTLKYIPLIILLLTAIYFVTVLLGNTKAYSDNSAFISYAGQCG